jgi:tetratricopeptide (TPR) repeat protein
MHRAKSLYEIGLLQLTELDDLLRLKQQSHSVVDEYLNGNAAGYDRTLNGMVSLISEYRNFFRWVHAETLMRFEKEIVSYREYITKENELPIIKQQPDPIAQKGENVYCLGSRSMENLRYWIKKDPQNYIPYVLIGISHILLHEYDSAVECLSSAVHFTKARKTSSDILLLLAQIFYALGDLDKAITCAGSSREIYPQNLDALFYLGIFNVKKQERS